VFWAAGPAVFGLGTGSVVLDFGCVVFLIFVALDMRCAASGTGSVSIGQGTSAADRSSGSVQVHVQWSTATMRDQSPRHTGPRRKSGRPGQPEPQNHRIVSLRCVPLRMWARGGRLLKDGSAPKGRAG